MYSSVQSETSISGHPIDVMETLATSRDWPCERGTEDDVNICIAGTQCDYNLAISWRDDLATLHIASIIDIRVPDAKRSAMYELLGLINEQLWLGHFDMWSQDGAILFRNTLMANDSCMSDDQCNDLILHSVGACERFFPAFQFLIWANYAPRAAIESAIFETMGDA